MNKYIFLSLLCPWVILTSCQDTPSTHSPVKEIHIADFEGKFLPQTELPLMQHLELREDTTGYIGQIKDICAIDSGLYLLDAATLSLSRFGLKDGKLQQTIYGRGNGPLEYIQPAALTADESNVYVLDLPGMAIITYNRDLKAQKKTTLSVPCFDFIKVDGGFLCYNLTPSDDFQPLIFIDDEGHLKKSFQVSHQNLPLTTGAKIFTSNARKDIFIQPPFSRTVYKWDAQKEKPIEYIRLDFGNKNLPEEINGEMTDPFDEPYAIPTHCFVGEESILCSFLYNDKRYYALSQPGKAIKTGQIIPRQTAPFFPQWQIGDMTIGTYSGDFSSDDSSDSTGEMLLLFGLNAIEDR